MKQLKNILGQDAAKNKRAVILFFVRLFIIFTCWFVFYGLILGPKRTLDKPLTNFITNSVTHCINLVSAEENQITWEPDKFSNNRNYLIRGGEKVFGIWDVCNGIDLMIIYIAVLFLLPYPLKRKLIFSVSGIVVITLANIVRVFILYFIYFKQRSAFDFSHHYLFTILMYILIFYGWLLFTKTDTQPHE